MTVEIPSIKDYLLRLVQERKYLDAYTIAINVPDKVFLSREDRKISEDQKISEDRKIPENLRVKYQILGACSYFLGKYIDSWYWYSLLNDQTNIQHVKKNLLSLFEDKYTVRMLCNWMDSASLINEWSRMVPEHANFTLTTDSHADYTVVLNATDQVIQPKKTMVFRMEPHMERAPGLWGNWSTPKSMDYLHFQSHENQPNMGEWWLDLNYKELELLDYITPKTKSISAIVSTKYQDPGHILRLDFLKFVDEMTITDPLNGLPIDVYGNGNRFHLSNYCGALPNRNKLDGLLPYRYTIAVENQAIPNYFTEKVIDGLLSGCLVFYWGCPNILDYFPGAIIPIDFSNKAQALKEILHAIETDLWSRSLSAIDKARKLILTKLSFGSRIHNLIIRDQLEQNFGKEMSYVWDLYQEYGHIRCEKNLEEVFQYLGIKCNQTSIENTIPKIEMSNEDRSSANYFFEINNFKVTLYKFDLPKAKVVNLDSRPDRWKTVKQLMPLGLQYERFSAVDGRTLKMTDELKHLFRDNDFGFRQGVVGCALSHLELWRSVTDQPLLILEDDIEFAPCFEIKLHSILKTAPPFWDVLFIGHHLLKEHITDHRDPYNLPYWEDMLKYSVPNRISWVGTFGYLVSPAGARKLVEFVETHGIQHGVDYLMQLRFPHLAAYGCRPMLVYSEYVQPGMTVDTDIQFNGKAIGEN